MHNNLPSINEILRGPHNDSLVLPPISEAPASPLREEIEEDIGGNMTSSPHTPKKKPRDGQLPHWRARGGTV